MSAKMTRRSGCQASGSCPPVPDPISEIFGVTHYNDPISEIFGVTHSNFS